MSTSELDKKKKQEEGKEPKRKHTNQRPPPPIHTLSHTLRNPIKTWNWKAWCRPMLTLFTLPQSLWVHRNFKHVDLEGLVFLVSFITSCSHALYDSSSLGFFEAWVEGFDGGIPLRQSVLRSLIFHVMSGYMRLCICFHRLQKEVSLILAKQGTDHKYSRVSLGVILFLWSFSRAIVYGFPIGRWAV